jgi:hypothetical protein
MTMAAVSGGDLSAVSLLSHVVFEKPDATHRVKPEGTLFRDML